MKLAIALSSGLSAIAPLFPLWPSNAIELLFILSSIIMFTRYGYDERWALRIEYYTIARSGSKMAILSGFMILND